MMYRGKMYPNARLLITVVLCAVCVAYAQDAGKSPAPAPAGAGAMPATKTASAAKTAAPAATRDGPAVKNIEVRSGARGMILIINGSGAIAPLGGKPSDIEKATAKYKEFTVNIAGLSSPLGATATLNPPPELPLKNITLTNVAAGLTMTVRMRNTVNGPIDVRNSDNQMRILLTRAALPEFVWSSDKGIISAPPAADAGAATQKQTSAATGATPRKQTPGAPTVASKTETPSAPGPDIKPNGEVTKKTPEGELVKYKVFGRDPFVPLVRDTSTTELPSVENLRLVGVLEDARERIALVEDFKNGNRAFALRTNDPVAQGKVLRVHRDKVVFLIRDFDVSHSYTLGLTTTTTK